MVCGYRTPDAMVSGSADRAPMRGKTGQAPTQEKQLAFGAKANVYV